MDIKIDKSIYDYHAWACERGRRRVGVSVWVATMPCISFDYQTIKCFDYQTIKCFDYQTIIFWLSNYFSTQSQQVPNSMFSKSKQKFSSNKHALKRLNLSFKAFWWWCSIFIPSYRLF